MVKIKTFTEQLAEVQQAITDILTGAQEATYNGQKVVKADLNALQKREEYLQAKVVSEKRGGIRVRGGLPC